MADFIQESFNSKSSYFSSSKFKAWIVSLSMGYGHHRAAFPLKDIAFKGMIVSADNYEGIPGKDKMIWKETRDFYEFVSKFKKTPLLGNIFFSLFDRFQKILKFYPKRDLSEPNLQLKQTYSLIRKGWGEHLIKKLSSERFYNGFNSKGKHLPFVSTFFTPAFMAEFFNYPGQIYCIVCDSDISRAWAPLDPKKSRIKYFAPTERVVERLKLYGVKPENIFLSGFPLPSENIGIKIPDIGLEILKRDFSYRLLNLDPEKKYFNQYKSLIKGYLGKLPSKSDHVLTLMFAIGGAGAQKSIGFEILKSLAPAIKKNKIKIILSAGVRKEVKEYFLKKINKLNLNDFLEKNIEIVFSENKEEYFKDFNDKLRKTDILWTKPSELSFYTALGVPLIIAPTVGSQEEFNKDWLLKSGFGISQENPKYVNQWLFDWLKKGYFAEACMEGLIEGRRLGAVNIKKVVFQEF